MRAFSQFLDLIQEMIDHLAGFRPTYIHQYLDLVDVGDVIPDDRLLSGRGIERFGPTAALRRDCLCCSFNQAVKAITG